MIRRTSLPILALIVALLLSAAPASAELAVRYLYTLSDFDGIKRFSGGGIALDRFHDEVFVMSGESVNIFNSSGMETYQVEYDPEVGIISDVAFKPDGNMIMLALKGGSVSLLLCNYRAEVLSTITLKGLPEEFASLSPSRVFYQDGQLYLADANDMHLVVTDADGYFLKGYDVGSLLDMSATEASSNDITGITLNRDGALVIVLASAAQVYRIAPDGTSTGFGKRGSGPGKFGVPTGIAVDREGNYLVSDRLRGVVLVFDKEFRFVTEFGFRGLLPGNLIVPGELDVDDAGRVYVTQLRRRGINVYQFTYD